MSELLSKAEIDELGEWYKPLEEGLNAGLRQWQAERNANRLAREAAEALWRKQNAPMLRRLARERKKEAILRTAALKTEHAAKRRAAERQRTPAWADRKAIQAVYFEAARLTKETGIPHHVDHVIPLGGRLVSGLHVANNLKPIPAKENQAKWCHYEVGE